MKKILKFYSKTCGPCKVMSKNLEGLDGVEITEVDIADEANQELVDKYGIRTVPTIIVYDDNGFQAFKGITPIDTIKAALV